MTDKTPELAPCPFCGGEAKVGVTDGGHSVWCTKCHCEGEHTKERNCDYSGESRAKAIAAWNQRASLWQPIETPANHRNDVFVLSVDGDVGIGWFSQNAAKTLTVEHLSTGDMKPTFAQEIAARKITHWMERPSPPGGESNA